MSGRCLRVGISAGSVQRSASGVGVLDGIGQYTAQLIAQLSTREDVCVESHSFVRRWTSRPSRTLGSASYVARLGIGVATGGRLGRMPSSAEVFHATDYWIAPMRCPVVASLWDTVLVSRPEWFAGGMRQRLVSELLRRAAGFADHCLVATQSVANEVELAFGVKQNRVSVVPCAIDQAWFGQIEMEIANRVLDKYRLVKPYILTVGTLQPRKNLGRLLSAYACLPKSIKEDTDLVVVGRCGRHSEATRTQLMSAMRTDSRIHWLSSVASTDDLRALYSRAAVFAFPSLLEGFGLPVVEAFASRVPVLTSDTPALAEVSLGCAVQVSPTSVDDIRDGLALLLSDERLREDHIRRGSQRAQSFTWSAVLPQILRCYRRLV